MSAATPESAVEPKKLLRPHPLTALVRGWVALLLVVINLLRDEQFRKLLLNPSHWKDIPLTSLGIGLAVIIVAFGLAGLATWWFTRYVTDTEEIRVETGLFTRTTKQIAVDRIQSVDVIQTLAPRLLGLAEVKIDVGALSATRIRYLARSDAYAMRDLLLSLATGTPPEAVPGPVVGTGSVLTDRRTDERVLVQVAPQRLAVSALLSTEFSLTILGAIAMSVFLLRGQGWGSVAFVAPWLFAVGKVVYDRVVGQWNYRLATSPRGLKVSRGLFDLTTQSIPLHRIQGIAIRQPLLWRRWGMYRIDVDVLGYGHLTTDEDTHKTSTILLPAGTVDEVATCVATCFPGLRLSDVPMAPVSPKRRYFHPIGWRGNRWGIAPAHVVIESGWWHRRGVIVPHARIQSVSLAAGPLDQRLGLGSVSLHTPEGPVSARIPHLDAAVAADVAVAELDRATAARRAEVATGVRI